MSTSIGEIAAGVFIGKRFADTLSTSATEKLARQELWRRERAEQERQAEDRERVLLEQAVARWFAVNPGHPFPFDQYHEQRRAERLRPATMPVWLILLLCAGVGCVALIVLLVVVLAAVAASA